MQKAFGKRSSPNKNDKWYAYAMISPIIIGFVLFLFLPLMYSLYLSMTDAGLKGIGTFTGLQIIKNCLRMINSSGKCLAIRSIFWSA